MSKYERGWYNAGRSSALALLPPLHARGRGTKAHAAYVRGYTRGAYELALRAGEPGRGV